MRKIVIVARRSIETGPGGVPVHCHFLQRTFPEAEMVTADTVHLKVSSVEQLAVNLGREAERQGLVGPDDIIIADGFWGSGFSNQDRVVIVCHGTYGGYMGPDYRLSQLQAKVFPGHHIVSVSPKAADEAKQLYGIDSDAVILTGVDTDIFTPTEQPGNYPVIGEIKVLNAKGPRGSTIDIARTIITAEKIGWLEISGDWPNDIVVGMKKCNIFIHISKHEGCSYSVNEALSCDIPIISNRCGLFWNYEDQFLTKYKMNVAEMVSDAPSEQEIINAIRKICANRRLYQPREWTLKYNSLEVFKKRWQEYIGTLQ